jgi:hypothetical protein
MTSITFQLTSMSFLDSMASVLLLDVAPTLPSAVAAAAKDRGGMANNRATRETIFQS